MTEIDLTGFSTSSSLGNLIARLEREDPARVLPIGFAEPHSFRGYYDQVAFEPRRNISIGDMLAAARSALGATYEGYKGGEYTMHDYTECWVSNYGQSSDNLIGPLLLELLLAQPAADHHARLAAGTEEGPCPACKGVTREPAGMVCLTCGTDYPPAEARP
jgi:hypothetical protein